jgi:hypothetical protein
MPSGNKIETKIVVRINGKKVFRSLDLAEGVYGAQEASAHLGQVQESIRMAVNESRKVLSI